MIFFYIQNTQSLGLKVCLLHAKACLFGGDVSVQMYIYIYLHISPHFKN